MKPAPNPLNFVLQNPIGSVYVLDPKTNPRLLESAGMPIEGSDISGEEPKLSILQVDVGSHHTAALMEDGTTGGNYSEPVDILNLTGVKQITAGENHTAALMEDGTVKAWGNNYNGQLGIGTSGGKILTPVDIVGLD